MSWWADGQETVCRSRVRVWGPTVWVGGGQWFGPTSSSWSCPLAPAQTRELCNIHKDSKSFHYGKITHNEQNYVLVSPILSTLLQQLPTFCHSSFISATPLLNPDGLLPLLLVLYIYTGGQVKFTHMDTQYGILIPCLCTGPLVIPACEVQLSTRVLPSGPKPHTSVPLSFQNAPYSGWCALTPQPVQPLCPEPHTSEMEHCVANITQGEF